MTETSPAPAQAEGKGRAAALIFILITVWIDVLSWGVTIPVFPRLFGIFTHNDASQTAGLVFLFSTMFAVIQLFAAPVLGALSDHFGRRPVILAACFGLGMDMLVMALMTVAPNFWLLLVTRIIHAITGATQTAAMAYVADVTTPERRARAFGLIGAAFGIGFIVGPGLGGLLGKIHLGLPFLAGGVLALINVAYGYFVLPESLPKERRRPFQVKEANPFGALKFLRADRIVFALAGVSFIMAVTQQLYPNVWVLYTSYRFNWDTLAVGMSLMFAGVMSAVVQGVLVGPLVKRLGERWAVLAGQMCWCIGSVLLGLAPNGWLFIAVMPLGSFSGIAGPALNSMLSRRVPADRQGELQGATSSLNSITGLIGPTLFAGSFAYMTSPFAVIHVPAAPFFIGAVLMAGALVLAFSATAAAHQAADAPA